MDSVLAECMQEIAKFEGDDNTPINLGGGCDGVMTAVTDPFTQEWVFSAVERQGVC